MAQTYDLPDPVVPICAYCDHFVSSNPAYEHDGPSAVVVPCAWLHDADGEDHEPDDWHNAAPRPDKPRTLAEWQADRPDLFVMHPDGLIGPNSAYHPHPQGDGIVGRLEYLRGEIQAERISMSEVAELQGLADRIEPGDNELLEWAGVPEFPDDDPPAVGLTIHEKVADADAMLDLLRHIIDQLEAGMTRGFHPGWELTDS